MKGDKNFDDNLGKSQQYKKNYSELIYNKKYLKVEKRINTKESFHFVYVPVLFDSVYRKNGIYFPKVFLEKFIHNFFGRNIRNYSFLGFGKST